MDNLPNELLQKIFSYLPSRDLYNVERVCTLWSQHIVFDIWLPRLLSFRTTDPFVYHQMVQDGFDPHSHHSIKLTQFKAQRCLYQWHQVTPKQQTIKLPRTVKMVKWSSLHQGENLILSLPRVLESRSIVHNFQLCHSFALPPDIGTVDEKNAALHANTLAIYSESKVYVLHAATLTLVATLQIGNGQMPTNVSVSDHHIVLSTEQALLFWRFQADNPSADTIVNKEPFSSSSSSLFLYKYIQMSANAGYLSILCRPYCKGREDIIVTKAFKIDDKRAVERCGSLPLLSQNSYTNAIAMSPLPAKMLAVHKQRYAFGSIIDIFQVDTGRKLFSITPCTTSSLSNALLPFPFKWIGNKLFYIIMPPENIEEDSLGVLAFWNGSTNASCRVRSVAIKNFRYLAVIGSTHVLHLRTLYKPVERSYDPQVNIEDEHEEDEHEHEVKSFVTVSMYNFWNC